MRQGMRFGTKKFPVYSKEKNKSTKWFSSVNSHIKAVFKHHKLKIVLSELYLDFLTTSFLCLVVKLDI
jgi:hypothetical protein